MNLGWRSLRDLEDAFIKSYNPFSPVKSFIPIPSSHSHPTLLRILISFIAPLYFSLPIRPYNHHPSLLFPIPHTYHPSCSSISTMRLLVTLTTFILLTATILMVAPELERMCEECVSGKKIYSYVCGDGKPCLLIAIPKDCDEIETPFPTPNGGGCTFPFPSPTHWTCRLGSRDRRGVPPSASRAIPALL